MIINEIGEFELISRLAKKYSDSKNRLIRGVGDDTAVLALSEGRVLLATCDAQIEGIHFTEAAFSPRQIGARAAAVNLSDIAAMGGEPTFALVSLGIPGSREVSVLDEIYLGLREGLAAWGAGIVGGNTANLPERLFIDVTLLGEVAPDRLLLRNGARPGDFLCVTGTLGASLAGLEILADESLDVEESIRRRALEAHCTPTPRVAEGAFLGGAGGVTACIDVSDGLYGDAAHIAEESGVAIAIDLEKIPVDAAARGVATVLGRDPHRFALQGGEDFELLFTVSPEYSDRVLADLAVKTRTPATVIGEIQPGPAGVSVRKKGIPIASTSSSFDHFRR